jgi:hypothetical protein
VASTSDVNKNHTSHNMGYKHRFLETYAFIYQKSESNVLLNITATVTLHIKI